MRSFIRSLVFMFLAAVSAAAVAAPAHLFNFNVIQFECVGPLSADCQFSPSFIAALNDQRILINPESFSSGQASLSIEAKGAGEAATIVNSGVAGMSLYPQAGTPVMLSVQEYDPANAYPFLLNAGLEVGPSRLGGSLFNTDSSSTVEMQAGGLVGPSHLGEMFTVTDPLEWVGYVTSDRLNSTWLRFTGEWLYAGEVPEPGTLALLLAGLAMVATTTRRRTTPQSLPMTE
ncbi:PEP-CTERM sorting domain-containing protein [Hydrogenophaga sp.]|uniref:PEP-CTERM sorting domain-containing protein n=1 Tax=Hydrogenophaga sp. TaxID=1904254 RepID=UPI0025BE9364|nr:PEP-CTERM sorting domain-containing protein [Hydrogenophaga sp.]